MRLGFLLICYRILPNYSHGFRQSMKARRICFKLVILVLLVIKEFKSMATIPYFQMSLIGRGKYPLQIGPKLKQVLILNDLLGLQKLSSLPSTMQIAEVLEGEHTLLDHLPRLHVVILQGCTHR